MGRPAITGTFVGHGTAKPSWFAAAAHSACSSAGDAISGTRDDDRRGVVGNGGSWEEPPADAVMTAVSASNDNSQLFNARPRSVRTQRVQLALTQIAGPGAVSLGHPSVWECP
jgi:hypothetical protein